MKALVIAAGKSSRFWPLDNYLGKAMTNLMAKPILAYTIESLAQAGFKEIVLVVQAEAKKEIKKIIGDGQKQKIKIDFVVQSHGLGQAQAILAAQNLLTSDEFFVFNASQVNAGLLVPGILSKRKKTKAGLVITAKKTDQPAKYGILKLKNNLAVGIVEKPAKGTEPSNLRVVGAYLFNQAFLNCLKKSKPEEYQLEKVLTEFMQTGKVAVYQTDKETLSLKYPWDLLAIKNYLLKNIKHKIDKQAYISQTALIKPPVVIGKKALVGDFAIIEGPAYIGDKAVVGAYSCLRKKSILEKGAEIQRYTDVSNSLIFSNAHLHSGFLGDSIVGQDCRIGAGFISANKRLDRKEIYSFVKGIKTPTGLTSFGVVVGQVSKIGIRVSTMPGKLIGKNCFVKPGKIVGKNLDDNDNGRDEQK